MYFVPLCHLVDWNLVEFIGKDDLMKILLQHAMIKEVKKV